MRLTAVIKLSELAECAGVSIYRLRNLLERARVPVHGGGRGSAREVRLSELRRLDPELYDSIVMAQEP